jgi:hypothetical protein
MRTMIGDYSGYTEGLLKLSLVRRVSTQVVKNGAIRHYLRIIDARFFYEMSCAVR